MRIEKYNEWNDRVEAIASSANKELKATRSELEEMNEELSQALNSVAIWVSVGAGAALSVLLAWGEFAIPRNVSLFVLLLAVGTRMVAAVFIRPRLLKLAYWLREFERAERIVEQAVLVTSVSLHPQLLTFVSSSVACPPNDSKMAYNSTKLDREVASHKKLAQMYAAGLAVTRIDRESIRKAIEFDVDVTVDRIRAESIELLRENSAN